MKGTWRVVSRRRFSSLRTPLWCSLILYLFSLKVSYPVEIKATSFAH